MPGSGIHTVTVPGAVKGWEMMRARFGRLPMADLLAPAIFYAEDGFPVTDVIADAWSGATRKLAADPHAAKTFLIGGRAPRAGEVFKNPDLAAHDAADCRARAPPDSTKARRPTRSSRSMREKGGTMTAADLKEYQPEWVDPISTTYRGWTVYELPPNTQGIAALMMLNLMEQFPLGEYGLTSAKATARDDRGEEARLRGHASLRRRSEVLDRAGAADAEQAARESARGAHRSGESGVRGGAVDVRRPDRLATAATRSTSPSSTATATSSR